VQKMHEFIAKHLNALCEIGNRFIGSVGNHAAAAYLERAFVDAGLDMSRLTFPCQSWQDFGGTLYANGDEIEILVNTYSPPCDVNAPLMLARSLTELEAVDDLRDCILVMCGELTQNPLSGYSENAVYLPDLDRRVGLLLRQKEPLAIITVCMAPAYLRPVIEDMGLEIPSATVSTENAVRVLAAIGHHAKLTISSKRGRDETSHIIATNLQPSGRRRVIACAHYDTNRNTIGAWDNGSGVAALLALAQFMSANPLSISMEYIAFTAEEYGVEGLSTDPYLAQYGLSVPKYVYGKEIMAPYRPSDLDNVLAVINFDGVGQCQSANTVSAMACSEDFKRLLTEVKSSYKGLVQVDGWPASNHYMFYSNGVPSIPISSFAIQNALHHPRDLPEWVSAVQVEETMRFGYDLISQLVDKTPAWCRMLRKD
jgi:aminopeptidase YwaD